MADTPLGQVRGFAMMLHLPDVDAALLEYVSTAPGAHGGGGLGGALYETVRDEALSLGVSGLFFECLVDEPALISDAAALKNNPRLADMERWSDGWPVKRLGVETPKLPASPARPSRSCGPRAIRRGSTWCWIAAPTSAPTSSRAS